MWWWIVRKLFSYKRKRPAPNLDAYFQRLMAENAYLKDRYSPERFRMLTLAAIPHYKRIGFSDEAISQLTEGISASHEGGMK